MIPNSKLFNSFTRNWWSKNQFRNRIDFLQVSIPWLPSLTVLPLNLNIYFLSLSYSTGWGVFCKIKEKTTIEYRLCCWTSLKLLTLGWRSILPKIYAFVSLRNFFFLLLSSQILRCKKRLWSLLPIHWWSWVTDGLGPLMVLGHSCYWVTFGLWSSILDLEVKYWSPEFYLDQILFTCIELQTAYIGASPKKLAESSSGPA